MLNMDMSFLLFWKQSFVTAEIFASEKQIVGHRSSFVFLRSYQVSSVLK